MRQLWDLVLQPVLDALRPQRILEIGVGHGLTTRPLAEFAAGHGAVLESIDPAPKIDVDEWQREFGSAFRCHVGLSLEVLPNLSPFDIAVLDGDPNWFTVNGELLALETLAKQGRAQQPLVMIHGVGWPYGRRDVYEDVATVPKWNRQPHHVGGLRPGFSELVDSGGFNDHLDHAIFELGERNGVLTAVEGFVAASEEQWQLTILPGLHGLGILAPEQLLQESGRLREAIAAITGPEALRELVGVVEAERIEGEIQLQAARRDAAAAKRELAAAPAAEDSRVEDLEAQILDTATEAQRLAEALADATRLRNEQESRSQRSQEDRDDAQRRLAAAEERLAALELETVTASRAREEASAELASVREQRDALELDAASARAAMAQQQRELEVELVAAVRARSELEGRMAASIIEIEGLRTRAAEDRETVRTATTDANAARAEADEAERQHEQLERRQSGAERREQELEEELTAYRRRLREATELREEAEYRASLAERRVGDQERETAEARAAATEGARVELAAQRSLAEREAEISELTSARLRLAADHEDARETMEQAVAEARWTAETAQTAARELRERLEVREVESDSLEEQISQLREALTAARIDAETARAHLQAAHARQAESEAVAARPEVAAEPVRPASAPAVPNPDLVAVAPPRPAEPEAAPEPALDVPSRLEPDPLAALEFTDTELQAHESFRAEYPSGFDNLDANDLVDLLALPDALNFRGFLHAEHEPGQAEPTVDVVVCIHNALEDVRLCLWSVLEKTDRPFRLILVNDGSDAATTEYLDAVEAREPAIRLIRNLAPPHGYTIAANLGLRAATGDYMVLLNSDTIVTHGWLDRIVECGEEEPAVGILGPLSNAASHQSVPELRSGGAWSTNPLPPFTTPDGVAKLLQRVSPRARPRLPFINGFCYVIKRAVIDAIGYLDEERFSSGYCEENDFSYRAGQAGFELAVVDDAYVFHAKSKSFGVETRKVIAKRNYEIFLDKHDREAILASVRAMESDTALRPLRARVSDSLASPRSLVGALDSGYHEPLSVVFVLPGLGAGGSGGSHSIYQEVHGMRRLGLDARIALAAKAFGRARAAYDDADEVFVPYRDMDELFEVTRHADVICATHFKSVVMLADLQKRRKDFLPGYYVQDYEPFFTSRDNADWQEASDSYTLVPGCLLFAKTHWLSNIVASRHGVRVAKVEPSIDEAIYRPRDVRAAGGPVRIAAMVRPRTPRRQPTATVAVMEEIVREHGARVRVTPFGCSIADLERLTGYEPLLERHRGLLSRTEVAELLWENDVFLDMSMYQAFGRTALEAMACGATAVVPRLGGVWEFLEHDGNGLAVDAFAPREAADALSSLIKDRERLHKLQQHALETGGRYSILKAALSEYLVFAREHALRFGPAARAGA